MEGMIPQGYPLMLERKIDKPIDSIDRVDQWVSIDIRERRWVIGWLRGEWDSGSLLAVTPQGLVSPSEIGTQWELRHPGLNL